MGVYWDILTEKIVVELLTDHFPCATKAIWYFDGIYIPTLLIFKVFGSQV
jgi:hypothetical protein